MRNIFTILTATMFAGAAFAETPAAPGPVLSGEVELTFKEDATTDKWGGAMGLELDINAGSLATIDLGFKGADGSALDLDTWTVGTSVSGVALAFGDDNGLMPGAEGEQTLAAPAMTESLQVTTGAVSVAVGLTDWTTDITDISNIQGAYTLNIASLDVTAAADYNMDSENTVLGAGVAGIDLGVASLGGAATYDMDAEVFGFEAVATTGGLTAYLNGDDTDALQNIGGGYDMTIASGLELGADVSYNINDEEFTPSVSASFSF